MKSLFERNKQLEDGTQDYQCSRCQSFESRIAELESQIKQQAEQVVEKSPSLEYKTLMEDALKAAQE